MPSAQINVLKAAGTEQEILGNLNEFRSLLGDSVNTTPGKVSGRREVNWDGVPANLTNNNDFRLDFFNNTDPGGPNGRKRELVYLNTGSPIRIDSSDFSEIDPSYAAEFEAFSKKRSLISANNRVAEIVFNVQGTNTHAFVRGFGIIFSDVDDANSTTLEFYEGNKRVGLFKAPARTSSGPFSFLGVHFPTLKITRIRITAGDAALGAGVKDISAGGTKDLVSMDDFFYDEPKEK